MQQNITKLPEYEELATALRQADSKLPAAESHGLLTGALNTEDAGLISSFFTDDSGMIQEDGQLAEVISQLVHLSAQSINSDDFNFQLLLPRDESSLEERSRALADWGGGDLMGLLEAGIKEFESLPADAAEVAKDLVEISQLDATAENGGSEFDLMQLEEYVRVGVQIIFTELKKVKDEESKR